MDEEHKSHCENVALKQSLISATLGLLAAFLLLTLMGGAQDILFDGKTELQASIFAAVVALYGAATCLGIVVGDWFYRIGMQDPRIWIIGIGLAWSCLLISVLAGSSIHFFTEMGNPPDVAAAFQDYIFKPVFWVMLIGAVPALGLGLLYTARVKKSLGES